MYYESRWKKPQSDSDKILTCTQTRLFRKNLQADRAECEWHRKQFLVIDRTVYIRTRVQWSPPSWYSSKIQTTLSDLEHRLEIPFFSIFPLLVSSQKKCDSVLISSDCSLVVSHIFIASVSAISLDHFPVAIVQNFITYSFREVIEHAIYVHICDISILYLYTIIYNTCTYCVLAATCTWARFSLNEHRAGCHSR